MATVVAALTLLPGAAGADFFNHRNVLVGERAGTMGGAYVALSDDATGGWYNPAGLAWVRQPSVSVSGNAYAAQWNDRVERLGGTELELHLQLNRFNAVPTVTGASFALSDDVTVGFGLFNTDRVRLSGVASASGPEFPTIWGGTVRNMDTMTFRVRIDNDTLVAGPSIGVRLGDEVSVGASVLYHHFQGSLSISYEYFGGENGDHALVNVENDVVAGGLSPIFGIQWRHDVWRLGLSYGLETLPLWGRNGYSMSTVTSFGYEQNLAGEELASSRFPHRFTFGGAWVKNRRVTLTADVTAYLPMVYPAPHEMLRTQYAEMVHYERAHLDASLGAEIYFRPEWAFRAGLFTNTSSASELYAEERVDSIGASLGLAHERDGFSSGFGVIALYGASPFQASRPQADPVSWSRIQVQVVYGGTYRLLD